MVCRGTENRDRKKHSLRVGEPEVGLERKEAETAPRSREEIRGE
jgi:hypothetical protein